MWINLDAEEVALLRKLLAETAAGERRDAQLFGKDRLQDTRKEMLARADRYDALVKKIADREAGDPADEAYRGAVRTSDELEVDDDAVVSPGGDPGAWVMAWVWVTDEEAGIEDIDTSDIPEAGEEFFQKAKLVRYKPKT